MYYIYSFVAAVIIAVMVVTNGSLGDFYDSYIASIIIHAVGLSFLTIVAVIKKEKLFSYKSIPILLYCGGAIGVVTTLCNNLAFGKISVTAIIALGLFAQTVTSLIIDQFGLFGMPVKKLNLAKGISLIFTLMGILYLLKGTEFHLGAIILSLATGVSIVLSRFVNAMLAERTNVLVSTWYNFMVGFVVTTVVWGFAYFVGASGPITLEISPKLWIYTGGLLGICGVALSSLCAKKIPALILTLIMFVGQLFAGILLDYVLLRVLSIPTLIGGILTTIGLVISVIPWNRNLKKRNSIEA